MILPYWAFISLVHLVENTFHVDGEGYDMIDEEEDYEKKHRQQSRSSNRACH